MRIKLFPLALAALLAAGCAPFGTSARAGFERGRFAGSAANDLDRAADELQRASALLLDANRTRDAYELETQLDDVLATLGTHGALTPENAAKTARRYADSAERLRQVDLANRATFGKIAAKVKAGAGDIEALVTAEEIEKRAGTALNDYLTKELLPEATANIAGALAQRQARVAAEDAAKRAAKNRPAPEEEVEPEMEIPEPPPAPVTGGVQ